MAWDWVEIQHGVVAMADPLGLVTNLHLLGDDGQRLDDLATSVRLHCLLHELGWQTEVERALQSHQQPSEAPLFSSLPSVADR